MTSLPLSPEKEAEWQTTLTLANNNNFPIPIIKKLKAKMHNKETTKNDQYKKWATFKYHSAKVMKIINLLKKQTPG
jgi:LEA14-like dessication related protein